MSLLDSEEASTSGVVRDVVWRELEEPPTLSFRVEQTDDAGNVTGYTQVMGESIEVRDVVSEGDSVTVHGRLTDEGVLKMSELENETTGVRFSFDSGRYGALVFLGPPVLGAVLGGVGGIVGIVPTPASRGAFGAALGGAGPGFIIGGVVTLVIVVLLGAAGAMRP